MAAARRDKLSRAQWAGFFALCALSASEWLIDAAWPSVLPGEEQRGFHELAVALVLCGVGWKSVVRGRLALPRWGALAAASVCLIAVPAFVSEIATGGVSEVTATALFAMVPIAVVTLVANFNIGGEDAADANRLLAPAVIGLAGILLLLQVATPSSWRDAGFDGAVLFGAMVSAVASVWMYRLLRGFAVIEAAVVCAVANAMAFLAVSIASAMGAGGVTHLLEHWGWSVFAVEGLKAVCIDLPQMVLLVWLVREIAPERFAARFLVIPLLTVVEGYVLLRPEVTVREVGGAALAVFGAWRLMTASPREEEPGLVLR